MEVASALPCPQYRLQWTCQLRYRVHNTGYCGHGNVVASVWRKLIQSSFLHLLYLRFSLILFSRHLLVLLRSLCFKFYFYSCMCNVTRLRAVASFLERSKRFFCTPKKSTSFLAGSDIPSPQNKQRRR